MDDSETSLPVTNEGVEDEFQMIKIKSERDLVSPFDEVMKYMSYLFKS